MLPTNSPTAQTIDGITLDLNRLTRRGFREYTQALEDEAISDLQRDELTSAVVAQVVIAWPFGIEVSADNYLDLGFIDSSRVDKALMAALSALSEKKSELPSISPENTAGRLMPQNSH